MTTTLSHKGHSELWHKQKQEGEWVGLTAGVCQPSSISFIILKFHLITKYSICRSCGKSSEGSEISPQQQANQ